MVKSKSSHHWLGRDTRRGYRNHTWISHLVIQHLQSDKSHLLKTINYDTKRKRIARQKKTRAKRRVLMLVKKRLEAERRRLPVSFPILSSAIHLLCVFHISLYQQLCRIIKEEEKRWRYFVPISVHINPSPQLLTSLLVLSLFALFFSLSIMILCLHKVPQGSPS